MMTELNPPSSMLGHPFGQFGQNIFPGRLLYFQGINLTYELSELVLRNTI